MANTAKQYNAVAKKCKQVFFNKNDVYGASWKLYRLKSMTTRIANKAQRIYSVQLKKQQRVSDSIQSEFMAIANYSIAAQIIFEKGEERLTLPEKQLVKSYSVWAKQTKELMEKKNHDYGEAWRTMDIGEILDEIRVKLARLKVMIKNPELQKENDDFLSNYQDIANYAFFALIHISKGINPME